MLITKKNIIIVVIFILSVITIFYLTTKKNTSILEDKNRDLNVSFETINNDSCNFISYNTSELDSFSLKIGNEYLYEAYEGNNIKYNLYLTRIENNKILCKFIKIVNDSIQLKSVDTVFSHTNNTNSSHSGKYYYQCNGKLYETFNRKKNIHLIIDDNKSNYVAYQIWAPNYLYNLPVFVRKGVDEPFQNYLMNLIGYNYAYESSNNRTLLYKELKNNYNDISILLNQIDSNNYNYNYKKDVTLLDKTIFFGLDSLTNIFISKGIIPRKLKHESTVQIVHHLDMNNFTAVVRHNINNKILSKKFECFSIKNKKQNNNKLPIGFRTYNSTENLYFINNNLYLMLMPDDGFENINYIMTIWKLNENDYSLESIIDTTLAVSIGGIVIDKILEINKNIFLIIGKSGGGDGGDDWGSVWFGKLTLPNSIRIIKEVNWSGNENRHEYVNYTLDSVNGLITIKKGAISGMESNQTDSSMYTETLNYLNFYK